MNNVSSIDNCNRTFYYPTQDLNETYGSFITHISGVTLSSEPPADLLRPLINELMINPQDNFVQNFRYASDTDSTNIVNDYLSHIRSCSGLDARNRWYCDQYIAQPERQKCDVEEESVDLKAIVRRLFSNFIRCLIPCFK